jgi:hypothetical protein
VNWVEGFPSFTRFAEVGDAALYAPLPEGWHVGVTDVVQSTAAIGVGRYKAVNIAGAAAISALMNALGTRDFPFAFAGDGCAFALPGEAADVAAETLAKTAAWVRDDLGLTLRTALVAVADIRAAGHDVRVAMFRPSEHVGYAMFDGGGVIFAERTMKSGALGIEPAAFGERPDLTGLSCRWLPIAARNGAMLSLIVRPGPASDRRGFGASIAELLELLDEAARSHPVPPRGPDLALVSPGLRLEALRRLACDCGLVVTRTDGSGSVLDVGRRTRSIPPAIRRALWLRDRGCRFPGCGHTRFLHGHHVRHWMAGGETRLDNLVLLCSRHHRALHEGGCSIERASADGGLVFRIADGKSLLPVPPAQIVEDTQADLRAWAAEHEIEIGPDTNLPWWDGAAPDYDWIISSLVSEEPAPTLVPASNRGPDYRVVGAPLTSRP